MTAAVETMAYAGKEPWHGLGIQVPEDISTDKMLKEAGLDWKVHLYPVQARMKGGKYTKSGEYNALVRDTDSKILSVAGKKWVPVQNSTIFEFLDEFVTAGSMRMETAGSLRDGRHVWALANLGSEFELDDGDKVKGYLLVSHPHEYGYSMKIMFTPIRVVCNNTLTYALEHSRAESVQSHLFNFRHTKVFDRDVMDLAAETLAISSKKMSGFQKISETLADTKIKNQKQLNNYLKQLFPNRGKDPELMSRTARKVVSLMEVQPGAEMGKGTLWQAANAVTFFADHEAGNARDSSLYSAWFGPRANLKRKAFSTAYAMAKAA